MADVPEDAVRSAGPPVARWPDLRPFALWALLLIGLCGLQLPARAGTVPGELPADVGRLTVLQGDARLYDRDAGGWQESSELPLRNWPLVAGDRLRTGRDGRAELRLGSSTVRLGADAELWLEKLDDQALVLRLQAGSLALRLAERDGDAFGEVELLTTEGRWRPQRPGHYRFDRQADATQASAWRGELHFEGRDSALTIPAGQRADLWLDAAPFSTTRYAWAGIDRDAFADWVARDERLDDAPITARHVPPGMSGWQDLDRNGDWVDSDEHGSLWQPRSVAPGWAPYHFGRWAWVSPWGWTWIDDAPWGFAPFHYGSWVMWQGRWGWSPGPRHHRPRFAPALSAWISGPQVGIGIRIGGVRPPPPRVVVPIYRPPHLGRPSVVVGPTPRPPVVIIDRHERPDGRDRPGTHDRRDRPDGERWGSDGRAADGRERDRWERDRGERGPGQRNRWDRPRSDAGQGERLPAPQPPAAQPPRGAGPQPPAPPQAAVPVPAAAPAVVVAPPAQPPRHADRPNMRLPTPVRPVREAEAPPPPPRDPVQPARSATEGRRGNEPRVESPQQRQDRPERAERGERGERQNWR